MMKALHVGSGELQYSANYAKPRPRAGEALIRMRVAGICATDLEIVKGYGGFAGVLGHEFVGEVVEIGSASQASERDKWLGRRVVGTINLGCQECDYCRQHGPEHCRRRTVLGIHDHDGAFAEFLTLPLANLLAVPEGLPDREAVFVEPLAAALRIRQQSPLDPDAGVAVVGPGRLGLLVGQVLALDGREVTMLGRHARSLGLPARLGLATGLATDYDDSSFAFVVEATGNEAGLAEALRLVQPLGNLVLKSTFHGRVSLDLTKLVVAEINVIGSRCGPFAPALRLLQRRAIEVTAAVDGEYRLEDGAAAFAHAAQAGVRKVLLLP